MSFQQLWAPWRIGYITANKAEVPAPQLNSSLAWKPGADQNCFLCRAAADNLADRDAQYAADLRNFVACRTELSVAVLNRYPYNNGHLLVAPLRHAARLEYLTDAEHLSLMKLTARLCGTLERLMTPDGFNIGLNLGRVAGAGLPGHVHWHIVPRWNGDTNFMPVTAGVNVIPQSLEALFELLHEALQKSN